MRRRLCAFTVAVCVLACKTAEAIPSSQNSPDAAADMRRQVETFREKDLLRVTLRNNSERLGCLSGTEVDGFVLDPPFYSPHRAAGSRERILFADILAVKREPRPNFFSRVVMPITVFAGLIYGAVKIGSNTPKTVAVKVEVAGAVLLMAGQSFSSRFPKCR